MIRQIRKEKEVLASVIEYLTIRNIPYARVNNTGAIFTDRDGQRRFGRRKHEQRGVSDIFALYRGFGIALEVKGSNGKVSPEQGVFLTRWALNGGLSVVVNHLEQLERFLACLDVIREQQKGRTTRI